MSKRIALSVGINDFIRSPLRGCVNDSNLISKILREKFGYEVIQLLNKEATKTNIIDNIKKIAGIVKNGDSFVFHISSHGTQVRDLNEEEVDGLDEAIVCYFDKEEDFLNSLIIDDDIEKLFNLFPNGCERTLVFDCCHSGSANRDFNKANRFIPSLNIKDMIPLKYHNRGIFSNIIRKVKELFGSKYPVSKLIDSKSRGVVFSACKDEETAADAFIGDSYYGAFTRNLVDSILNSKDITVYAIYNDLLKRISIDYSQNPQLKVDAKGRLLRQIFT